MLNPFYLPPQTQKAARFTRRFLGWFRLRGMQIGIWYKLCAHSDPLTNQLDWHDINPKPLAFIKSTYSSGKI
jgi:hypothetical protein